jgi:uncharacterized membrane protein YfhO
VIESSQERINFMNSKAFRPRSQAIVETEIPLKMPLGVGKIEQIPQEDYMHKLAFKISDLDKDGFLVISETYYPAGWKAYIDGQESEIYPVNHILRGLVIPAGSEKVEMVFAPESYYLSTKLSLAGISLSLLILLAGIYLDVIKKRKEIA